MRDTQSFENVIRAIDCLRGLVNNNQEDAAIYIVKELQKMFPSTVYENELWVECEKLSHQLDLSVPFINRQALMSAFHFITGDIDYEILLALKERYTNRTPHTSFLLKTFFDLVMRNIKNPGDTMLIPEGEKFAPYLTSIVENDVNCRYIITTARKFEYVLLTEIFKEQRNVQIIQGQIYEPGFINEKFDTILSVPNYGTSSSFNRDNQFMCREYDLIATENLLLHLSPVGKLIILLPARVTFAAGRVKDFRRFIQHSYSLDEIAELPVGVLSNTGVKTFLFTISAKGNEDTSIKRYVFENDNPVNRRLGSLSLKLQDETFIMPEELDALGDWNVDKIFASQDEDWTQYQNSSVRKIPLKDVAEIFRGKAITEKNPTGSIGVINISNILEYDIDYNSLDHLEEQERRVANYILKTDDLLLPARGTAIRTAVFNEQTYPCIASSNLIVIRPKSGALSGTYLKLFLDSAIGKKLIKSTQQGTAVMNISYRDLENIEIPYLPFEKQKEIAQKYTEALAQYKETISSAEDKWQDTVRELEQNL
ncbi:MAG: restriction endonuclease subunit S [Alphaproteobacteria bacterium]|nr:restriction endonuclease subunit S [Alphaproteobacteria bacterium]